MSKNLFKKGLAFGAVLSLGVTGFTGIAASAATGDVTLAPTSGTKYGAFSTDPFSVTTKISSSLASTTTLAYKIENPDQHQLYIDLGTTGAGNTDGAGIVIDGYNALGQTVDLHAADASTDLEVANVYDDGATAGFGDAQVEKRGEIVVDFKDLAVTTIVIRGLHATSATNAIRVQPNEATVTNTAVLSTSAGGVLAGASDAFDFGDGDASVTLTAWVESGADYTTVDASNASASQKISWFDPKSTAIIPRVERFVNSSAAELLDAGNDLVGSIEFTKAVNLDQVNLANWNYKVAQSDGTAVVAETALVAGDATKAVGYTKHDAFGRILAFFRMADNSSVALDATKDYVVSIASTGTGSTYFSSVAYALPKNDAAADQIHATVTDGDNALQTDSDDLSVSLRSGTKAFTYKAQIKTADATLAETASIQVLAIVTAGSYLSTGGGYTVSGATSKITNASEAVIVTGFTDSKGQFSVTVTSEKAVASEAYTVDFYVLDGTGSDETWTNVNKTSTAATYVATYADAAATTLVPESTVLAGASVTAKFTVKDQFGKATAVNGAKALSIELQAANSTNLDKDAVVAADGTASFTFTNYVTSGSSDVLTAKVYTGSASVPTFLGGALTKTLSLYNPGAASAVNAPATLATTITYDDFITGTANTTTNVAPNDGSVALTGSVVDANGTGIPGAVVTIAGKGLQLQKSGGTDYYLDTITVAADAAGAFNVNVFAHAVNTTGSNITITAGGKTATTVLKTYFPATLVNGNNLVFSWKLPALLVKNTTYAVTAKLADKWGNPVATTKNTADAVSFQGTGSVEVNSVSTAVTKNFDKTGSVTVFVRSVKDIAGPGSVSATLNAGSYYKATSSATDTALAVTEITTNDTATKWDETAFKNSLESNVEILDKKPTASISKAATSTVVVKNANGTTVKVVRGTKSKTVTATSNSQKVTLKGGSGSVKVYVNGVLVASK